MFPTRKFKCLNTQNWAYSRWDFSSTNNLLDKKLVINSTSDHVVFVKKRAVLLLPPALGYLVFFFRYLGKGGQPFSDKSTFESNLKKIKDFVYSLKL